MSIFVPVNFNGIVVLLLIAFNQIIFELSGISVKDLTLLSKV